MSEPNKTPAAAPATTVPATTPRRVQVPQFDLAQKDITGGGPAGVAIEKK